MAGYSGWSQSNNAIEAKREGRWPLSHAVVIVANEAGVSRKLARETLEEQGPCEWHHSSKKYNCVDFYDTNEAIESLSEQRDNNLVSRRLVAATRRAFTEAAVRQTERQLVIGRLERNRRLQSPPDHGARLELEGEIAAENARVQSERQKHLEGTLANYRRHPTPTRAEALRGLGIDPASLEV